MSAEPVGKLSRVRLLQNLSEAAIAALEKRSRLGIDQPQLIGPI